MTRILPQRHNEEGSRFDKRTSEICVTLITSLFQITSNLATLRTELLQKQITINESLRFPYGKFESLVFYPYKNVSTLLRRFVLLRSPLSVSSITRFIPQTSGRIHYFTISSQIVEGLQPDPCKQKNCRTDEKKSNREIKQTLASTNIHLLEVIIQIIDNALEILLMSRIMYNITGVVVCCGDRELSCLLFIQLNAKLDVLENC